MWFPRYRHYEGSMLISERYSDEMTGMISHPDGSWDEGRDRSSDRPSYDRSSSYQRRALSVKHVGIAQIHLAPSFFHGEGARGPGSPDR